MSSVSPQLEIRGIVKPRRRWPTVLGVVLIVIALGLGTGTFAYAQHYRDRVLPHTVVGKISVGGLTPQQLTQRLTKNCQELRVKFTGEATGSFRLADLGLHCDVKATVKTVMAANENLGELLVAAVQERKISAKYDFDETKATSVARSLTANQPGVVSDPGLLFDTASASFVVDPGTPGQGIDPKNVKEAAIKAWAQQSDITAKLRLTKVQPRTPDPKLPQTALAANELIKPRVYLIGRGVGHLIAPDQKASWVDFSNETPTISTARVQSWLQSFSDAEVDVKSAPGQRELTKDGKLLRITKMAWPSRRVINNAELSSEISAALNTGKNYRGVFKLARVEGKYEELKLDVTLPRPPYTPQPGEVWSSVDLTNHTVSAWRDNKLIFGPVAVVHGSIPSPTYPGIFHIQSKHIKARMKMDAWDGSYDVWSPWTMYYSGNYALHGSTSRSNWVQSDYGGSHGCVNMKPADAKELYRMMRVGSTVVVHRGGKL